MREVTFNIYVLLVARIPAKTVANKILILRMVRFFDAS